MRGRYRKKAACSPRLRDHGYYNLSGDGIRAAGDGGSKYRRGSYSGACGRQRDTAGRKL